jgi:hypothetical protein
MAPDHKPFAEEGYVTGEKWPVEVFLSFRILSSINYYLSSIQKSGLILVPLAVQSAQPLEYVIILYDGGGIG